MATQKSLFPKVQVNNDAIGFVLVVAAVVFVIGFAIFKSGQVSMEEHKVGVQREQTKREQIKACKGLEGDTDVRLCLEQVGS